MDELNDDLPVGDYSDHPEYILMRIRILMTGTAAITPAWSEALKKLWTLVEEIPELQDV